MENSILQIISRYQSRPKRTEYKRLALHNTTSRVCSSGGARKGKRELNILGRRLTFGRCVAGAPDAIRCQTLSKYPIKLVKRSVLASEFQTDGVENNATAREMVVVLVKLELGSFTAGTLETGGGPSACTHTRVTKKRVSVWRHTTEVACKIRTSVRPCSVLRGEYLASSPGVNHIEINNTLL
jgi:hypothetical protein